MAESTFEGQAAAVRNVMRKFGVSAADRANLVEAERTLEALARLRRECLAAASADHPEEDFTDRLGDELIKLLRLPTES